MLIKEADDQAEVIAALQRQAESSSGQDAKRAAEELKRRKAGLRGEAESTYLINFDFGQSPNWGVLHDLRLEHRGRTAQIDHLLINRWMEFFVLETKQFHAGVKVTEDGEFLRWNAYRKTYEGMASPLQQNERHIAVLADVLGTIDFPSRFGMRIPPTFHSLVLVAPTARIDRPKRFDASRVIKADQLKPRIWREIDADNPMTLLIKSAAKLVSAETAEFVGRQLALRHTPSSRNGMGTQAETPWAAPSGRVEPIFSKPASTQTTPKVVAPPPAVLATGPTCKACGKTSGSVLYGKYGYYFKCDVCSTNTAIRFTCKAGHAPRLRKDGDAFYRDCKECATSTLFHRNGSG